MNEASVIHEMLFGAQEGATARDGGGRSLAVIGLSDRPDRPSHYVSAYMQSHGYKIYPVNPALESVLGERCHGSLAELPVRPDVVNVFRLPNFIPAIVEEMLAVGFRDLWIQQGIVHREAAKRAEEGGIRVVMDRCIMVEHRSLVRL